MNHDVRKAPSKRPALRGGLGAVPVGALWWALAFVPVDGGCTPVSIAETGVFVSSTNIGPPIVTGFRSRDEGFDFASVNETLSAPGAANSTSSGYAFVELGHIRARASAVAADTRNLGGAAGAAAAVTASWSDTLTLTSPSLEAGHGLLVSTAYLFPGSVRVSAFNGDSQAEVTVMVDGFAYILHGDDDGRDIVPPIINFMLDFSNGQSRVVSSSLGLAATAGTSDGLAIADADFEHSLHWGGILSVTDAVTGARISDWTLTSESGTDYSRAIGIDVAAVPEPGMPGLWMAALALLFRCRRPRATAPHAAGLVDEVFLRQPRRAARP